MGYKHYFIKQGFYQKAEELPGGLDLDRTIKFVLNHLHVANHDSCCDTAATTAPLRFNVSGDTIEFFNPATQAWVEATAPNDYSSATGITAFAGGGQGSAVALAADFNEVTTVATAGDSVKLPAAVAGLRLTVKNTGANAANVFPATADSINALAVNTALSIPTGATITFYAVDGTVWESSNSLIASTGGVSIGSGVTNGTMIAAFYPQVAQQNIVAGAGGAINVTSYLTTINTDAGGDAFTLANGTVVGQMKKILLVADGGGDGAVTPATAFAGGAVATFNDAADYLIIQWSGSAWVVLENSGVTIA